MGLWDNHCLRLHRNDWNSWKCLQLKSWLVQSRQTTVLSIKRLPHQGYWGQDDSKNAGNAQLLQLGDGICERGWEQGLSENCRFSFWVQQRRFN